MDEIVGDRVRERRAEHRDGRGEHDLGMVVAGEPDRFQQRTGAGEIDRVAFLEIRLGFAGHDGGQMEDHVGPARDRAGRRTGHRKIDRRGDEVRAAAGGRRRGADVGQRQARNRPAGERAIVAQARRQLAADHARRAGAQDVHGRVSRHSAMPPSTRWVCPVM